MAHDSDSAADTVSFDVPPEDLADLAAWLRVTAFETIRHAGTGHLGAAGSSAELMAALYFGAGLRLGIPGTASPRRDRVLVRGHLGPLRAAVFTLLGHLEAEELQSYRQIGSRLQGHEDHSVLPCVDISPSGSLGMLLSYGVGSQLTRGAMTSRFRTVVFLGDGEEEEGVVGEAARHASTLGLSRLIAVVDKNGKQLSCSTAETDACDLAALWTAYGWEVLEVSDGHDVGVLKTAFAYALSDRDSDRPLAIIAKTEKGRGLPGCLEHVSGYHTIGVTPPAVVDSGIDTLKATIPPDFSARDLVSSYETRHATPRGGNDLLLADWHVDIQPGADTVSDLTAAQTEYFEQLCKQLVWAGDAAPPAYFLTADVTHYHTMRDAGVLDAMMFINVGLREQHSVALAHGIAITDPESLVIINAGDAFTYRSIDQLNAAAQGEAHMLIIGDVAGLTEARNGKTHQSSGQPGAVGTMPGVTFLEPASTLDLFDCLNFGLNHRQGPVFVRVSRGPTVPWTRSMWGSGAVPSHYLVSAHATDYGAVAKSKVVVVACGLPVTKAVSAAQRVYEDVGAAVDVIVIVNHGTLRDTLGDAVPEGSHVLCYYNGNPAVLAGEVATSLVRSGRRVGEFKATGFEFGTTGSIEELLARYRLDEQSIYDAIVSELDVIKSAATS